MAWITLSDVYDDVRFKVNKTSTDVSDANLLRIANKILRELYAALIGSNEGWYTEIATFDLAATSSAANREYTLPADSGSTPWGGGAIKILRVEAKPDGTNWKECSYLPFMSLPEPYNETDIRNSFDNDSPAFSIFDNSWWLWSGNISATVTGGGRIFYVKRNAELTASSATPDLPNEFLSVLSTGMSRDLYERFGEVQKWQLANSVFETVLNRLTENQSGRETEEISRLSGSDVDYS